MSITNVQDEFVAKTSKFVERTPCEREYNPSLSTRRIR